MKQEEIEAWYEAEKEKATAQFGKALNNGKDRDEEEKKFKTKMKELHRKYEDMMLNNITKNNKNHNSKLFLKRIFR